MTQATQIVLVEDDPGIRRFLRDALTRAGHTVVETATAQAGLAAAASAQLTILDLGLPDLDGVDFIRALRRWSAQPVLVLSARTTEDDKIAALDAGADDYLTKPFGIGELQARLRVLLRRHAGDGESSPLQHFGTVEVDFSRNSVRRNGFEIKLTQLEYRLLATLLANAGKVMTHRRLMAEVWGPGHAGQEHYLRIYMRRLRQKLEADATRPQHLLTETGVGYRLQP